MWDEFFTHADQTTRSIKAPTNFPQDSQQQFNRKGFNTRYKYAWEKIGKQTFTAKDGGLPIRAYLKRLNWAQMDCPLSEPEFRIHIARYIDGNALTQVMDWIEDGISTQSVYNRLLKQYDKMITPTEAEHRLNNFELHHYRSWAQVESAIKELARRAAQNHVGCHEEMHRGMRDQYAMRALLKCMPDWLQGAVKEEIKKYANLTGKSVTLSRFLDITAHYADTLDEHVEKGYKSKKKTQKVDQIDSQPPSDDYAGQINALSPSTGPAPNSGNNSGRGRGGGRGRGNGRGGRGGQSNNGSHQPEAKHGRGYEKEASGGCVKCISTQHTTEDCPYYEGKPAPNICQHCHLEARHWNKDCLFKIRLDAKQSEGKGKGGNVQTDPKN